MTEEKELGPIVVAQGRSAAGASHPEQILDEKHLTYHHNPVPWWLALIWVGFLIGGSVYLIVNLAG